MPVTTRSGPGPIPAADYYECGPEFQVGSWSPSPDATTPATQVHLRFGTPPGRCMVVRFKGPGSLDALIDSLVEHREYVFGKPSTAAEQGATLATELVAILANHVGERGDNEGVVEVLRRIIRERDQATGEKR